MRKTGIIKFFPVKISQMKLDPEIILVSQAYFKSHNALNALHDLRFGHVGPPYKHFPDANNTCKFEVTVSYLRDLLSHHSINKVGKANLSPNRNSFAHKHKSVYSNIKF